MSPSPYNLTVCVVNYNGERYLKESLETIFFQKGNLETILVDNASEDRSLQIVGGQFPGVKLIKLNKNAGPAAARNVGFRAATYDLILFVDNDVSLAPSCSDQLIEALNASPSAAIAMPRVLYAHNKNTIQYDGADLHFLGLMMLRNANQTLSVSRDVTRRIGSLVTACFLIDRRKWGDSDPFDDTFFFNYEDHDFGVRARIFGYEILSVPTAHCYHREGTEGLSLREGGTYSRMRVFCLIRNRWQVILKNYEFKTLLLVSPVLFTYECFQLAGVIKKGWFIEWVKAFSWIILHFFEILRKRRNIQKARKIPDREILRNGPIPFRENDLIKSPWERRGLNFLNRFAELYWRRIERFI